MKKFWSLTMIFISVTILSGCLMPRFNFHFEAPPLSEYQLIDIAFEDYMPAVNQDFSLIEDILTETVMMANIKITNIAFDETYFFSPKDVSTGSGVIFYESEQYYYVLTNEHVISKSLDYPKQIFEVEDYAYNRYDGFIYEGSINPDLDFAIIVFEKGAAELTVLSLVNGRIDMHEQVIVYSNPGSQRNVLTVGLVTGARRVRVENSRGVIKTYDFLAIIHSAEIDFGSSGSMVIDFDFKIVGVNFAKSDDEYNPDAMAIPSDLIVDFLQEIFI